MADLAPVADDIRVDSNTPVSKGQAGTTLVRWDVVYKDSSGKYQKCDCTDDTRVAAHGVVLTDCDADEYFAFIPLNAEGALNSDSALFTKGTIYVVSATANGGKIAPLADLVSTNRIYLIGIGETTKKLKLLSNNTKITI